MSLQLDQKIEHLRRSTQAMASAVGQAIGEATTALLNADVDLARQVWEADQSINDSRYAIEDEAITVIATQQPVAGNLRVLSGILEISSELERMGDYGKDIARVAVRQSAQGPPTPLEGLAMMASDAKSMLAAAMESLQNNDAEAARETARQDDKIDEACRELHQRLLVQVHAGNVEMEEAVRLLPAVHNIERFADRATNICERVVYIATGERVEFDGHSA